MSKILFVLEGIRKEKMIADSLSSCFFGDNVIIKCAFCTTIYNLYSKILKDPDLDTFSLLKEILSEYKSSDFAEIYLFFDYDGHTSSAHDDKMHDILERFNEETEYGKLYVNYPMVESLQHHSDDVSFKELKVPAKENIAYKKIVVSICLERYKHFHKYTEETWSELLDLHLKKMNFITEGDFILPISNVSQSVIFSMQLEKYIKVDSSIAVLNSFPLFLFDYFGASYILELIKGRDC